MERAPQPFFYDLLSSPLGPLGLIAHPDGLSHVVWSDTEPNLLKEIAHRVGALPERRPRRLAPWRGRLDRYFSGKKAAFDAPIFWTAGTPFQRRIWTALAEIPYGEVRSYQWVADRLGLGPAARAVGNACGRNPLPIVIPCHRVVHRDGSLGGYTGGLDIKMRLLAIERVYLTENTRANLEEDDK